MRPLSFLGSRETPSLLRSCISLGIKVSRHRLVVLEVRARNWRVQGGPATSTYLVDKLQLATGRLPVRLRPRISLKWGRALTESFTSFLMYSFSSKQISSSSHTSHSVRSPLHIPRMWGSSLLHAFAGYVIWLEPCLHSPDGNRLDGFAYLQGAMVPLLHGSTWTLATSQYCQVAETAR
jgi:hypothetical protein